MKLNMRFNIYIYKNTNEMAEKKYPKVMLVCSANNKEQALKRVVFMEKNNLFMAWNQAETIEESKKVTGTCSWNFAWDIDLVEEMTLEQVCKELGRDIKIIK